MLMLVHFWQYQLRQQKSGAQMHRNHLIEIGEGIFFNGNDRPVMTSIVHQNSHRTEFFACRLNDLAAIVFARYVSGRERNLSAAIRNLGSSRSKLIMRAGAQENRGALFCEEQRNGAADTAA